MRFLIVTTGREAGPPEMAMPLLQAMRAWLAEHRASGKLVDVWSFAGSIGGGGIVEVESHEELDAIMAGFPYGQTSHVDVYPLADLDASLDNLEASIVQMMQAVG
jgi:muconolactone delta-isomerase